VVSGGLICESLAPLDPVAPLLGVALGVGLIVIFRRWGTLAIRRRSQNGRGSRQEVAMTDIEPRLVVVPVYDGVALLDLAALDVFKAATELAAQAGVRGGYAIKIVASRGGPVASCSSLDFLAEPLTALDAPSIDTILVPGGARADDLHPPELVAWLREHAPDARRVVSVCTGAFVLAKAGLLSGRRATTHWAAAETLKARYPDIRVEPALIFIQDGNIWTSAGASAGIDLALALVQQDLGHQIAMQVARALVVYLKRAGGQSQYSAPLAAQCAADPDFAELHSWVREHMHEDLDLEALAERAGVSTRTLERRCVSKLGQTPLKVLETMRLETARLALEDPSSSLKEIARRTGFGDQQRLRRAFQRRFGVTPAEYRERFSVPASSGRD
jgi:transcriptional regulator GlxA family with amidase domain